MTVLVIDAVVAEIRQLPVLPTVVVDLLQSIDDGQINTHALAHKMSQDQALVARLLRVANSSFYGMEGKVCTIQQAIIVLGVESVRMLVAAAAIIAQFPARAGNGFDRNAFWRHAIGVACAAKLLAPRRGQNGEVAFVCGLLHDIGRLVLALHFSADYARVLAFRAQQDAYLIEAEREVLGLDHAMVGAALAERWKFPQPIRQALADHHLADAPETAPLAALIHVADVLAHALGIGSAEDDLVPPLAAEAWARMGMTWKELGTCFAEIEALHKSACGLIA